MTTRRGFLALAGGATAALLGACSSREPSSGKKPGTKVPDVVLADSEQGLVVLGGARPATHGKRAAASADGRVVFAVDGESLMRFDPADGISTRSTTLGGGWLPRTVSRIACALSRTPAAVQPAARKTTSLLVTVGGEKRQYDLPGVVEPDAFTTDNTGLFVLEWLPATAPDHYRVRLLDLATGEVGPLLTRDKTAVPPGAEEEMRGEGRQAVLSPDEQVLYTLYTHQPGHRHTRDLLSGRPGNAHAFVHVLHLTERWAYCLDLPHPFGEGPPAAHAIAASADGRELAVFDASSGNIAYAGTAALAIAGVVTAPKGGNASLAYTPDGTRVLAGAGRTISALDHTGTLTASWSVPADVRGLAVSPDGQRVYCGGDNEVLWLDATKAGDTKAGDTKAGDAKAGDAKAGDAKAGDAKAGDAKGVGVAKAGEAAKDGDAAATVLGRATVNGLITLRTVR
ncbi:YncE family protein [Actinoplanes sp. NPDC051513]|uniref:YncE family protein n=1 Tax=Actinoplanes sp. NPDC051513 TaxID=3363908 RepID=UPI0037A5D2D3